MAGQIGRLGIAGAVVGLGGLGDPAVGLGEGSGPEGGLDAVAHEDVHEAEGPRRPTGLHQPGGLSLGQRLETHESRLAHRCRHQPGGKCPADDGCGPQDIATVPRATADPAVDRLAQGRRHRSDVATGGQMPRQLDDEEGVATGDLGDMAHGLLAGGATEQLANGRTVETGQVQPPRRRQSMEVVEDSGEARGVVGRCVAMGDEEQGGELVDSRSDVGQQAK